MAPLWTKAEENFLRECALAKISTERIAVMLERTCGAVRTKRNKLKLAPPRGFMRHTRGPRSRVTVADIKRIVSRHFRISADEMSSGSRTREMSRPRHVAMFFAREVAHKSYPHIGALFGRDHSTVMSGIRKVERLIEQDHDFKDKVTTIRDRIVSEEQNANATYPQVKLHETENAAYVLFSASA